MKIIAIGLALILASTSYTVPERHSETALDVPTYEVLGAISSIAVDGRADDPDWARAEPIEFIFPWNDVKKEGAQSTVARLLWDEENLYVIYECIDPYLDSEITEHDGAVYQEDAVELFATPNPKDLSAYFGYEMNIKGTLLDYIAFDAGEHSTRSIHFEWQSEHVQIATTHNGTLNQHDDKDSGWTLEIAIPFANFRHLGGQIPPQHGDLWRLNLNRTKGHAGQFSMWSDTRTKSASFHHSAFFGKVYFVKE